MPRLLLTGFEPFGGADVNPSARLVAHFTQTPFRPGLDLHCAVLPVSAQKLPHALASLLDAHIPGTVLMLGESRRSSSILVEQYAANDLSFDGPDNDGLVFRAQPVVLNGPAGYHATLPVQSIRDRLTLAGIPCDLSTDAGRFLCNQALYLALHWAADRPLPSQVGFLHLPSPHRMPFALQLKAVEAAIDLLSE